MTAPHQAFHVMVKPRGALCNLACRYCFYTDKAALYPGVDTRMSDEVLESFTRQYIAANAPTGAPVTFAWQGGEPALMGLDFFRRAVDLQRQHRPAGVAIENAFQTNGTLLDGEWCAFLAENNFLVGLSVDGPQPLHDTYRVDRGGGSSYAKVMRAAELLREYGVRFNTLTCVHAANADRGAEVYRFLRDEVRSDFLQFIPIVERGGRRPSRRSVTAESWGRFLIDVFEAWVRRDVGRVFVQAFNTALAVWSGHPAGLCVNEPVCGVELAMEHNGDLYACDHFVDPRWKLGNILETPLEMLAFLPQQQQFGQSKREGLAAECRACDVLAICQGGCPKDRGPGGLNRLCAGYRAFYHHIDQPMRIMAALIRQGRAPAEIMRMV